MLESVGTLVALEWGNPPFLLAVANPSLRILSTACALDFEYPEALDMCFEGSGSVSIGVDLGNSFAWAS